MIAPSNGRELIGVSFLRHGRCRGQQGTQLVHRRLALLIGVVELDELLDGLEERAQIKNEGRELSDGELGMKVRRDRRPARWCQEWITMVPPMSKRDACPTRPTKSLTVE